MATSSRDIPDTIPEVGSVLRKPVKNPEFDPTRHGDLTSEDYFVWSRITGQVSIREIILETGFPVERAIEIVRRLRRVGAFLMPGERAFQPSDSQRGPATHIPKAIGTRPPGRLELPERADLPPEPALTASERAAMQEDVDLSAADRLALIQLLHRVRGGNYFDVLGVTEETPRRDLKRAYFDISKRFHPDRYYGKHLGSFAPWLTEIFEAASLAFDTLGDPRKRERYLAELHREPSGRERAQTHQEHAAELFEAACGHEARRSYLEALKLFAAVIRVDPDPRYLRRAARCALSANQLSLAEQYAKKAAGLQPDDASCARLLAGVYRASGKLKEAQVTLEQALARNPDSDVLQRELQTDLTAVRQDLESAPRDKGD